MACWSRKIKSGAWVALLLAACREEVRLGPARQQETVSAAESAGKALTDTPFTSRQACLSALQSRRATGARSTAARVASWNVRWFPMGDLDPSRGRPTDIEWLACAVASLDAPVVAVQEFTQTNPKTGPLAKLLGKLDALTAGRWQANFDTCPGRNRQHVGFLYDAARVSVRGFKTLGELNPKGGCNGGLRPGFAGYFAFAGGPDLHVVSVHFKAGTQRSSAALRKKSVRALGRAFDTLQTWIPDRDVLFAGDFNTVGDRGRTDAAAELAQLSDLLRQQRPAQRFVGADQACSHTRNKNTGSLLDHFVVPAGLQELAVDAEALVAGTCRSGGCASTGAASPANRQAFKHLSDHCPIVVQFAPSDIDAEPGQRVWQYRSPSSSGSAP